MEAQLEVNLIKSTQKHIDTELAQQFVEFNKEMVRKLNERALDKAFQLYTSRT